MPQAVQITATHLRALAGHTYARGEAYWRDGRVRSCVVGGDSIEGVVAGSAIYHVRVSTQAGALVADCTCPVQYEICKHAVALVLQHLDGAHAPVVPPVAPKLVDVFADRAELEAFVAEHQVAHVLGLAAEVLASDLALLPQDFWIKTMLARLSLR
nr:SWIM zinc finger family protein [Myxococcota bacterium]